MKKLKTILAALAAVVATFAFAACDTPTESCEHEFTDVVAVAATCETAGLKAHKLCSKCGLVMVGDEEKTAADVIVPALGHDYEAAGEGAENYFDEAKHFVKNAVCKREGCGKTETFTAIQIGTADELMRFAADVNAYKDLGCYSVELTADIDLSGKTWIPINVEDKDEGVEIYNGKHFVLDGKDHKILNLATVNSDDVYYAGLFGRINQKVALEIKNLTLKNANINAGINAGGESAVGGFVAAAHCFESIKFTNCKIESSSLTAKKWAGGLYGHMSDDTGLEGYGTVVIDGCSVIDGTITCAGSVGSAIGHAGASTSVNVTLKNSTFKNNTVSCTLASSKNKAGSIIGTVDAATAVVTNCIVENVTATSDGATVDRIYGRLAGEGTLTVDGTPIAQDYNSDGTAK